MSISRIRKQGQQLDNAVQLAQEAQVQQLFLFHHDPATTDEILNERQFLAQQLFPQTFVAREGLKIPLHSVRRDA